MQCIHVFNHFLKVCNNWRNDIPQPVFINVNGKVLRGSNTAIFIFATLFS